MKIHRVILSSLCAMISAVSLTGGEIDGSRASLASPSTVTTIRAIVGANKSNIANRLEAVHALGKNLSRGDVTALCAFLKSPLDTKEPNLSSLYALKNDILNALHEQATPPAGLTDTLIEIYRDPAQDSVIRDYAVQHLVECYEQGTADTREKIRPVINEATRENSSIAGTALLGVHRLSVDDTAFNFTEIKQLALSLAISGDTQPATRITAIQVCAERGIKEALPTVESLAQMTGNIPLKISAIAALGRLGGQQQADLLRRLVAADNGDFQIALQTALTNLKRQEQFY